MSNTAWHSVITEDPCHVCGKLDWCSVSSDGKKAICRRRNDGTGESKVDASEQDYWLYDLNDHGFDKQNVRDRGCRVAEADAECEAARVLNSNGSPARPQQSYIGFDNAALVVCDSIEKLPRGPPQIQRPRRTRQATVGETALPIATTGGRPP